MKGGTPGKLPHHTRAFQVRSYEAGPQGRIKLPSLLEYFYEAASEHAGLLGAGVTDLVPKNLTWVLSRYHIRVFRYPLWQESVEVVTWPSTQQNLFALREFELRDAKGDLLAAATSSWMLLDLKDKKPVKPSEYLPDYPHDPKRALAASFAPLPVIEKPDLEMTFRVGQGDLDWNRHANHVVYVEWALEAAPEKILARFEPAEVEVDYRGETFFGEMILSRIRILPSADHPHLIHQIVRADDLKELARVRTLWRE